MDFLEIPIVKFALMCIALVTLVGWIKSALLSRFDKGLQAKRLAAIETLIAQLSDTERAEIENSIEGKRKIEAIKFMRAATNAGLRDAKDAVEHMIRLRKNVS